MSNSIFFADGFDSYTSDKIPLVYYANKGYSTNQVSIENDLGRDNKGALRIQRTLGNFVSVKVNASKQFVVNVAIKLRGSLLDTPIIEFCSDTRPNFGLMVSGNGTLCLYRAYLNNIIGVSKGLVLNRWYHFQIKFRLSTTYVANNGYVKITMNGRDVIYESSVYNNVYNDNADVNIIALGSIHNLNTGIANEVLYDDFYITETTDLITNDYPKDKAIKYFVPQSVGVHNQFQGSDGNNVDNHLLVSSVFSGYPTNINSSTSNAVQTFGFTVPNFSKIALLKTKAIAKKSENSEQSLQSVIYNGSVTELAQSEYINTERSISESINLLNPLTGLPWSYTDLNSVNIGVKIKD